MIKLTGMSADAQHLKRINALLEQGLALPAEKRQAWLAALPEGERTLVPELRALLARADDTDTFMRLPVALTDPGNDEPPADREGDTIGPYRLLREIGHGGMGTVWLAERVDGALQRQVALKLPRTDWPLGLAHRMARERDILAALEHPHIARLYDAGTTGAGRPWLAMEHVQGLPIDEHCRARALDVPQRLRLFLQVADAVAHAHARLVVHRDLKPSNILVTPDGQVQLLDFGVAKLLEDDASASPDLTQQIGRAVTPDYAAPEQVAGGAVTVAADVYSLGVVLYELLTGERPYRIGRVGGAALELAIRQADVAPASARAAGNRRLARQLRGDLDTIVGKALRKDPARRYSSVEAMASDVQRHLAGEPVCARAPGWRYRSWKFARRHRFGLAIAGAVAMSLLLGLVAVLWQAREATQQAATARSRLLQLEATLDFTTMVLTEGLSRGESLTLEQLIRRSEALAESRFATSPASLATAVDAVVGWYHTAGDHARAEQLLDRTLKKLPADFDATTLAELRCKHGYALAKAGRIVEGRALATRAIEVMPRDAFSRAHCLQLLGLVARQAGDTAAAVRHAREALQAFESLGRESLHDRAQLHVDLAFAFALQGQTAQAMAGFAQAQRLFEAAGRTQSPFMLSLHISWGVALGQAGDPRAALARFDQAADLARRLSPDGLVPMPLHVNRGVVLRGLGRLDEALQAQTQALALARQQDNPSALVQAHAAMAITLSRMQRLSEALEHLGEAERSFATARLPEAGGVAASLRRAQATVWQRQQRWSEADALLAELQATYAKAGQRNGNLSAVLAQRARGALDAGRADEAAGWAEQAITEARSAQGDLPHSVFAGEAWLLRARALSALGQTAAAREAATQALGHFSALFDDGHPQLTQARELGSG